MSRKILFTIVALLSALAAEAQVFYFNGELSTHFDNTEYSGCEVGTSRTIFAIRATQTLGYRWNEKHSVEVGAELLKDFGSKRFLDEAKFVAYYQFRNEQFGANAGIFPREKLIGKYSRAFFSDEYLIYNSLIQGVALRHTGKQASVELAIDWNGIYSPDTREQFRVLAATEGKFANHFYAGAAASLQHYANKSTFQGNVVDNALINPYIGTKFSAFFNFDIRLGYLQSLQQDRHSDSGWVAPMGGELYFKMERWGVFIDNNLYVGKGLTPFYNTVGADGEPYGGGQSGLYTGDPLYGTTQKIYNRTGIGYSQKFAKERVKVHAEMVLQVVGKRLYCQQLVGVSAVIAPTIYNKANHK
ncbi:MAG: hypothetical protein IJ348_06455 [Alistipes sp.]|nr:hypothetical protein [Alistipes sp.]